MLKSNTRLFVLLALTISLSWRLAQAQQAVYLQFDGKGNYVELDNGADFSLPTTGAFTVSAWIRPDSLHYDTGYVNWLGKGTGSGPSGQQEWTFRLYSDDYQGMPNAVSFYVFNPQGGLGVGSHFVDQLTAQEWIHVVGMADSQHTYIYKNGIFRQCNNYLGNPDSDCRPYCPNGVCVQITPQPGSAPVRMGTRDNITSRSTFFAGGLTEVRVWNRLLGDDEISNLYASDLVPQDGLVAEYLLNSDTGNIAVDTAGNHTGTIFGATWAPR